MEQNENERILNTDPSKQINLSHSLEGDSTPNISSSVLNHLGLWNKPFPSGTPMEQLIEAFDDPDWTVRVAIVRSLAKVKKQLSVELLLKALRDEHKAVRATAARALGELSELVPTDPLITVLGDSSWEVRADVVETLGKFGGRTPIESLISHLPHEEDEAVRAVIMQVLGHFKGQVPIGVFADVLLHDLNWSVREAAALALGEVGEREPLIASLANEKDEMVLKAVELALQQLPSELLAHSTLVLSSPVQPVEGGQIKDGVSSKDEHVNQVNHNDSLQQSAWLTAPRDGATFITRTNSRWGRAARNLNLQEGRRRLGKYELVKVIGRGGSATVYLGEHSLLRREVAVKVLESSLVDSQAEQFYQEAHLSAKLRHPNLIQLLDYDIVDGIPFLVMDYAPKGTIRQKYPQGTRVPLSRVVSYVKQVAAGIQYLHENRIIHCDVKPENMLLGNNEEVLLCDFGIAIGLSNLSSQQIRGTVHYMAPEVIQGKVCEASDQYSLAVVIWEWLSGTPLFSGTMEEVIHQHIYDEPPSLQKLVPTLSATLEQVLLKALQKEPAHRFPSIQQFATALEEAYTKQIVPFNHTTFSHITQMVHIPRNERSMSPNSTAVDSRMIWRMRWYFAILIGVGFLTSTTMSVVAFILTGNLLILGIVPSLIILLRPAAHFLLPVDERQFQLESMKIQQKVSASSKHGP